MEVENHPDIDQLEEHSDQEWIKAHVDSCERCSAIVEGLQLMKQESLKRKQPIEQLISNSKERSWDVIDQQLPKHRVASKVWFGSAVVTLLLLAIGWIVFIDQSSSEGLDVNSPYPAPAFRSSVDTEAFIIHYRNGNYEMARKELQRTELSGENMFYTGLTHLYQTTPSPDSALMYFNSIEVQQSLYAENAAYYTAIANLMLGDTAVSRRQLEIIEKEIHHSNQEEAQTLLQILRD